MDLTQPTMFRDCVAETDDDRIAELAHDLRNMLSCALLHLELLPETLPAALRSRVEKSMAAIERARLTMQQAVDAADLRATLKLTRFDVANLADAIASEMSVRGGTEITVAVAAGTETSLVSCPARLTRILHNLIFNAISAMGPGGRRVDVTVRRASSGVVEITIADQGPGLPEAIRARLGGHRLPSERGGGLGLSAAVRMADLLGGGLAVAASGPTGTVFSLTIRDFGS
ncbi:sensor histidine kinase [Methylobrevis pamukkalensis]|uniref:histidine kinase n=1 Tax=Methylobrevis pamukkalensis TaxID=1439726 RepID=A0A1E3H5W0_9HYPH|nr:HAMP domain-containing sensor histidine kinase [Methylobrevis pamukkalensis]ODN71535.1 Swarming motility regulation sensor protein RssA [Methylobrevis pamukkalensis]